MFNDYLTARYTWFWLGENFWTVPRLRHKYGAFAWDARQGLREDFTIQAKDGHVVGRMAIWKGPAEKTWELGITLRREDWGNRYAEEAIREMARHVFEDLGGTELRFRTEPENEPMLKQYERMGIRKVIDAADDVPEPPLFHRYHHFLWTRPEWSRGRSNARNGPGKSLPPVTLPTARLTLRTPVADDIPAELKILNDYPANRFMSSRNRRGRWTETDATVEHVTRESVRQKGDGEFFVIQKNDDAKVIGRLGIFWPKNDRKSWEIGVALHSDHWGNHYAEEALREAARYAFETMGAEELRFRVIPENQPMLRQLERLGIKKSKDAADMEPEAPYFVRYHQFHWAREEWARGDK